MFLPCVYYCSYWIVRGLLACEMRSIAYQFSIPVFFHSYWIVRGLLACEMRSTAKHVVMNLLSLVDTTGHIPNGARTYYENRRCVCVVCVVCVLFVCCVYMCAYFLADCLHHACTLP